MKTISDKQLQNYFIFRIKEMVKDNGDAITSKNARELADKAINDAFFGIHEELENYIKKTEEAMA